MNNIYKEGKSNSIKFTKFCIFDKDYIYNNDKEVILRNYQYFYLYSKKNKEAILNELVVWIDDINISHMRESKHIFLDGTWY